jgi:hypothetical protein
VPEKTTPADDAKGRKAEVIADAVADDDDAPPRFGSEPGYDATD